MLVVEVGLGVLVVAAALVTMLAVAHCVAASVWETIVGVLVSGKITLTLEQCKNGMRVNGEWEMNISLTVAQGLSVLSVVYLVGRT